MPQIATFVDTTLPSYYGATTALLADGWKKVPNTKANRRNILLKYYEYLVNTNAKIAGINPAMLTPAQLAPVWETANRDYTKYEMYVKTTAVVANAEDVEMGGVEAPPAFEEVFASVDDVDRMQPGYVDIDDILSGFGRLGLGGGKRRKRHMKSHKRVQTHRRKLNKRKTQRYH